MGTKRRFRFFLQFIQREKLHRLLLILVILVLLSTLGLAFFEPNTSLADGLWWSIVTLTTVGYGDITPNSLAGRLIGILIMLLGIGIIALFTASIASIFVTLQLRKERGMSSYNFEKHIILCEWNHRAKEIIQELRSDRRVDTAPIVLIAEINMKPVEDEDLFFIQGSVNEENLKRANLEKASTVIILGDDTLDPSARDAKAVLATLTVESINPAAYTIVELIDATNARHCERAKANEIIVGSEFNCKLISRATVDHGISRVLADLLSSRLGNNDLFKIPVPEFMANNSFIEIFSEMKRANNIIVLAVQKGNEGEIVSNPPAGYHVESDDHLIVISEGKPEFLS
jgi:voltage-gated potassium channel